MSDSQRKSWSNNPDAPNISYDVYLNEKSDFAGLFVGSMLYGVVVVVTFKCIAALLNPAYRRGDGIKWGLVCYTATIFSLVTVLTGMHFNIRSISYIDNRNFPGAEGMIPPGPFGYQQSIGHSALSIISNVMFVMCIWLADGLLLYRYYIIYGKNRPFIAFPCLMYLSSVVMGIMLIYANSEPMVIYNWAGLAYLSISFSFNVLLTLMIVIRLILHARNTRAAVGIGGICGSSKTIVTMLIESCALYAVSALFVIGSLGADDGEAPILGFFLHIINQTQVIAPLLIIQRVANKREFTSNTITSRHLISSFKIRSRGMSTGGNVTLPGRNPISLLDERGVNFGELGDGDETTTDFYLDKI